MKMHNSLARDLDHILAHTEGLWEELRGKRLFITGGTGFFGCWLLESFVWANECLGLDASAVVLTRNPVGFRAKAPHLAGHPAIELELGDVRLFRFPKGEFPIVIHAATEAYFEPSPPQPLSVFDPDIEGTRRVLEFASSHGTERFLFTSSGAVYGNSRQTCRMFRKMIRVRRPRPIQQRRTAMENALPNSCAPCMRSNTDFAPRLRDVLRLWGRICRWTQITPLETLSAMRWPAGPSW